MSITSSDYIRRKRTQEQIRRVQEQLAARGHRVAVSGKMDGATQNAIRQIEKKGGLAQLERDEFKASSKGAAPAGSSADAGPGTAANIAGMDLHLPPGIREVMAKTGTSNSGPQAGLPSVTAKGWEAARAIGFRGDIGGWGERANKSDHPHGLALDLMTKSGPVGNALADFYIKNAEKLGTKYVIWNGQIASAEKGWKWRPYSGPSPHTDHVHVSFYGDGKSHGPGGDYQSPSNPYVGGSGAGSGGTGGNTRGGGSWNRQNAPPVTGFDGSNGGFKVPAGTRQPMPSIDEQGLLEDAAQSYGINDTWLWMVLMTLLADPGFIEWAKENGIVPKDWEVGQPVAPQTVDYAAQQGQAIVQSMEGDAPSVAPPSGAPSVVGESLSPTGLESAVDFSVSGAGVPASIPASSLPGVSGGGI